MELKLKISKCEEKDIRKGIIRIDEYKRNKIESGSLVILKFNGKEIPRIILGIEKNNSKEEIIMDEDTRKSLGIYDYDFNKKEYYSNYATVHYLGILNMTFKIRVKKIGD